MTDSIKLQVKNLNFYYGAFHALKNINMEIPAGKVTAFIGPSGCGKSTLLRIFNRMYELYPNLRAEGELLLDGKNILGRDVDVNLLRAKVGMVFQKPTPFPMSIYDNIAFGIKLYERLPKSEMDDRIEWALKKAALVSDYTAYMYLGDLVEFGETDAIFTAPKQKATEDYITGKFG